MFPIPLLSEPSGATGARAQHQSSCAPTPFVMHKTIDSSLRENECMLAATRECLAGGRLEDAVAYLSSVHVKLLGLGLMADEQVKRHGRKQRDHRIASVRSHIDAPSAVSTGAFPASCAHPLDTPLQSATASAAAAGVLDIRRLMLKYAQVGILL